eukprot:CAMPEP_0178754954 /NCGR_PEP_ID=MMETSP0744-20121128/12448_1 /TAXON_ID=913974 /ORGANISM="Nitzschia punctata, Strain CCMP561" /LENGTH=279 /DNA_ID=CAMNT_0020408927 /DNA_START=183 /DNA_END=1022 /DNA_ORIENTATION=-
MVSVLPANSSFSTGAEREESIAVSTSSLRDCLKQSESQRKSDKRISTETCHTVEGSCFMDGQSSTEEDDSDTERTSTHQQEQEEESKEFHSDVDRTTATPSALPPTPKRTVNFDSISIREFARALGDNPATTNGPPLTLDWDYEDIGSIKVDEYEETRPPRRVTQQMVIPGKMRERILLSETPTTKQQINSMISEVRSSRHKRQVTVAMQDFEEWHKAFEFLSRRIRRMRKGISKQREQELLWEQAHEIMSEKEKRQQEQLGDLSCTGAEGSTEGVVSE